MLDGRRVLPAERARLPSGGGDYEVATTNLGPKAGLTVASALLVDYVLTVAVSISSGVENVAVGDPVARAGTRRRSRSCSSSCC